MKDPLAAAQVVLFYGLVHFAAHKWQEHTESGKAFRTFCQTWKTDSLLHLILCAGTVVVWGMIAIFCLAYGLRALGV